MSPSSRLRHRLRDAAARARCARRRGDGDAVEGCRGRGRDAATADRDPASDPPLPPSAARLRTPD